MLKQAGYGVRYVTGLDFPHLSTPSVITRSEIPHLHFGTGSAISEIATLRPQ
jgi:hypothetical protein